MSAMYGNFQLAIDRASTALQDYGRPIHTERWQGIDISKKPEAEMREVVGWDFQVPMTRITLDQLREQCAPSLPFADVHFEERVCGKPINPGEAWKIWPFGHSAKTFLDEKGRFTVNYMERFWAGDYFGDTPIEGETSLLTGIRGKHYGDLGSIVKLMAEQPLTRQAWLPIYFPEDTGAGGRVPCSLGYHWMMRNGFLHCHYPIRSCDFYRHFRDDIYLAVRLTMWLHEQLIALDPMTWKKVELGRYSMWIGSLHVFVNDYQKLFGSAPSTKKVHLDAPPSQR